jgi:excisionase family DNA binding protein
MNLPQGTPATSYKVYVLSEWISVKEAAAFLGNVSEATIRRLFDSGELVGVKIAGKKTVGRVKLQRTSVEKYLAQHTNQKPPDVVKEEIKKLSTATNLRHAAFCLPV